MNLDTLDKSFLRLVTDFSVAKSELMENSQYVYKDVIVISPNEIYAQISNSLTDIAFDDSYIVELVDCNDNAISDITDKIFINEFQDINGIYQIAFEVAPIEVDYYFKRLFFRFTHIGSDLVVWSNPFILTDYVNSVRLDYKSYSYYQGISYDRANYYQSIRIVTFYNLPSTKETTKIYTQLNGDIRRSRTTQALEYSYNIEAIDTFTFDRLSNALNSDLVYLNGVRFKTSENVQSEDRQGVTNQFASSFKGQFEPKDNYTANYQIAPPFELLNYTPVNVYTLASFPTLGSADLSRVISTLTDINIYDFDTDELLYSDLVPTIMAFNFSFALPILPLGNYYITFNATSELGQVLNLVKGDWTFSIALGDYSVSDYNSTDYFTT